MIKVEMTEKEGGVTAFAFECNTQEDYAALDKLRVMLLGDHPTRGGYVTSNRLVVETKIPVATL